ncbi:hypothetical protein AKJ18_16930 [Vibrio xuii]|nr:hypothetical protein AKJ18_16930 [Vibrio xuii]
MHKSFSHLLKEGRRSLGLTQLEFCDRLHTVHPTFNGIDVGTLSRWENGASIPSNERKIIMLIELGMEKHILDIELKENLAKKKKEQLLVGKLFPSPLPFTYYTSRTFHRLTSPLEIDSVFKCCVHNHNQVVHGEFEYLCEHFSVDELLDKFSFEMATLTCDKRIMGHVMTAFVPKDIVGKGKPYYRQIQAALEVVPHTHIKLLSCCVIPEPKFFSEVISLMYESFLNDTNLSSYYTLAKSHANLWNSVYELYSGESIYAHQHPSLDLLARYYLFPPYTALSNPLIRRHYLDNSSGEETSGNVK